MKCKSSLFSLDQHQPSYQIQLTLLGTHLLFTLLSFQELPSTVCFPLMLMTRSFSSFTLAAGLQLLYICLLRPLQKSLNLPYKAFLYSCTHIWLFRWVPLFLWHSEGNWNLPLSLLQNKYCLHSLQALVVSPVSLSLKISLSLVFEFFSIDYNRKK